jgi:phosphate-selective porin OprO/OprP
MRACTAKLLGGLVAGGVLALLLAAGPARASDPAVEELRARLDKLEKENTDLKQRLESVEQAPVGTGGGKNAANAGNQDDVKKMIDDALKQRDDKKKKADAEKKAEDEAKKQSSEGAFYQVGSDLELKAHYKEGRFWLDSPHKDFGVWVGGYFQQDWVYPGVPGHIQADPSIGPLYDSTYPRRARIDMFGYAWEQIEWGVELDFENSPLNSPFSNEANATPSGATFPSAGNAPAMAFTDMWAGVKDIPFLGTVRVGHVRDPFGLENYSSSMALHFMERAASFDAFMQEFQPGLWGFNSWCDQRLNLAWSITELDQPGFNVDVGNGDYAFTGRIACLPIWRNNGRCFLHLAADYQYRSGQFDPNIQDHDFRFRARPDIHDMDFLLPRFVDTGNIVADRADLFDLEGLFVWGPFWLQSEFTQVLVNNAAVGGKTVGDLNFQDFYVQAGYYLTGESCPYDKRALRLGAVQQPIEPFFWVRGADGHHHWGTGAWEVCFRYDVINLDSGPVRGGSMETYTAGLNWYLNPQLKFMFNYILASREVDDPKAHGNVHFFGTRFQLNF